MPNTYHHTSHFGPGARHALMRHEKSRMLDQIRDYSEAGLISPATQLIAMVLINMLGNDGKLDPSHATIAQRSGRCVRTVQRAIARLRALGFLAWTRRIARVATRVVQITSAYVLRVKQAGHKPEKQPKKAGRQPVAQVLKNLFVKKETPIHRQDEDARQNAIRQLQAIGAPIPAHW